MNIKKIAFREVIKIAFDKKMTMMTSEDNYIHGWWICCWCASSIWIGKRYIEIPTDVFAYFLSPQQYEELVNILNEGEQ